MRTKIVLVGYRATGKSTLAARLAERWGFEAVDTDDVVEARAGKRIADIFAQDGPAAFRDLEAAVVADLANDPRPMVLATGGGVPLREENRRVLRERGVVVWLTATVETIARRMRLDKTTAARRPALTDAKSPIAEIERVLTAREPIYREVATLSVAVDGKTVDELVEEIADRVPEFFAEESSGRRSR
jgi:shikimate kinase